MMSISSTITILGVAANKDFHIEQESRGEKNNKLWKSSFAATPEIVIVLEMDIMRL